MQRVQHQSYSFFGHIKGSSPNVLTSEPLPWSLKDSVATAAGAAKNPAPASIGLAGCQLVCSGMSPYQATVIPWSILEGGVLTLT